MSITTNLFRKSIAESFIASFSSPGISYYIAIGGCLPWSTQTTETGIEEFGSNEFGGVAQTTDIPPDAIDNIGTDYAIFKEMQSLKRLTAHDVSLVIPRNTWISGSVYSQYDIDIPLASLNPPFYVSNADLDVYKCISNANGLPSKIQPTGHSSYIFTLGDGYQWKYMFSVNSSDTVKFVTNTRIPVKTLKANDGTTQWTIQTSAIPGTIDRIDLDFGGSLFTTPPTVTIVGDGNGATATAFISNGVVSKVQINSNGRNYTYANVVFSGGGMGASGAVAVAIISPRAGHGSDPASELCANTVGISTKIEGSENGTFTTSNTYRRITLVQSPILNDGSGLVAFGADYCQATSMTFGSISGAFSQNETVSGSISGTTAVVLDYNATTKTLRLVNLSHTFIPGETIVGAAASAVFQYFGGILVSATGNTVTLPHTASSTDDFYKNQILAITSGSGNTQTANIVSYSGNTKIATINPVFPVAVDNTSHFSIVKMLSPALLYESGSILYIDNLLPIDRSLSRGEDIKIFIPF